MSTVVRKVCVKCGVDVAGQKRVKDDAGQYYCHPCYSRARQQAVKLPEDDRSVPEPSEPAQNGTAADQKAAASRRASPAIIGIGAAAVLVAGLSIFAVIGRGGTSPPKAAVTDSDVRFQNLLDAAEGGDVNAMTTLATRYESGNGAAPNPSEARRWWLAAAAKEQPAAMFRVAVMHLTGEGADQSVSDFVRLATAAAGRGDVDAMNALAAYYEQDGNQDRDAAKAISWYRRAAAANDKGAADKATALEREEAGRKQREVVAHAERLYKEALDRAEAGDGVGALAMLNESADLGDGEAATYAGFLHLDGTGGVPKNPSEAETLFLRGAAMGDGRAMAALGAMYTFGLGIDKNIESGIKWYKQGVELGSAAAMTDLAGCYENGVGVPRDTKQAVQLYRKAASVGNAQAMFKLASAYKSGNGVNADAEQAVAWYQKAAAAGHEEALKVVAAQQPLQRAAAAETPQALVEHAFESGYFDPKDCTPLFARQVSTGERVSEYRLPKNTSEYKVTRVVDGQITYVKLMVMYGSARGEPRQKTITYSVEWNGQRWMISGTDFMEKYP